MYGEAYEDIVYNYFVIFFDGGYWVWYVLKYYNNINGSEVFILVVSNILFGIIKQ